MTEEISKSNFDEATPSIVILHSGEKLITHLQEAYDGEGENRKGVCLIFNHPYVLEIVSVAGEVDEQDLQVKFSRWCPYAIDSQYRIPYNQVVAVASPDPGLANAYKLKVKQAEALMDSVNPKGNIQLQQEAINDVLSTVNESNVETAEV